MLVIEIRDKNSEEAAALVSIKTKKYQAIPLVNENEDSLFMIATARKSSVEAMNICPRCGKKISIQESRKCELCGSDMCVYCMGDTY